MAVTRLFHTAADAAEAILELRKTGFSRYAVQSFEHSTVAADRTAIVKSGISRARARVYAEAIEKGATLVIVDAPLGSAWRANAVFDKAWPGDLGTPQAQYESVVWDFAAPLSSLLGLPLLLDDPTPLSSALGWPVLTKTAAFFSTSLGLPLISHNAAPLSSALKIPLLNDTAAPLSDAIKLKVLTDEPAPLSKKANIKVLSDDAAPLSKRLGLKVLSDNPTPLSSLLHLPVLWR